MADCMEKDWSFTGSDGVHTLYATIWEQIGRASCRERVCQYV